MTSSTPEVNGAARLDYLERAGEVIDAIRGLPLTSPDPVLRGAVRLLGVAREGADSQARVQRGQEPDWIPSNIRLLAALHSVGAPLVFIIRQDFGSVNLIYGTWASSPSILHNRMGVLSASLAQTQPEVDLEAATVDFLPILDRFGGFVLGIPTLTMGTVHDTAISIDRLLRSVNSEQWAVTIVARPVPERNLLRARSLALNESRDMQSAAIARTISRPLLDQYDQQIRALLEGYKSGVGQGAWRVAVYLTSTPQAYDALAGAVKGAYSGALSVPDPIRVFRDDEVPHLACRWALVDVAGRNPPGLWARPYEYQTLMSSAQLAAYVDTPMHEVPGFTVRRYVQFDRQPRQIKSESALALGVVAHGNTPLAATTGMLNYNMALSDLTRHVFVAGVTGQGKTNTVFGIVRQIAKLELPFLIVEPAKTEYRSLIHMGLRGGARVYTVAREDISPLRINPFSVIQLDANRFDIAGHIDRLRSLFVACFGLWNPLPAILEQSLYRIYVDRGWDLQSGKNNRLPDGADPNMAFPSLADLSRTVEEVIGQRGYERQIADNLRAALSVRVDSLRLGAKGKMFDSRAPVDWVALFEGSVVVELEGLGDEDDKAFLMGLLLIQLSSFRRSKGRSSTLRHLLVVEEAHRLLRNVARQAGTETNNSAYKAVETFGNLLAEVRAYGEGVVIVDQVPSDLAPVVLKNTNLKIIHRLVAADDRLAVGSAMAMSPGQIDHLATLERGRAAVFAEGDDSPLLVQVNPEPEHDNETTDEDLRKEGWAAPSDCPGDPAVDGACCSLADSLLHRKVFQECYSRLETAAILPGDLQELLEDLRDLIENSATINVSATALARCVAGRAAHWMADKRGTQYSWDYDTVAGFEAALLSLTGEGDGVFDVPIAEARATYSEFALRCHRRTGNPYRHCPDICPDGTCVFRGSVIDFVNKSNARAVWQGANSIPAPRGDLVEARWFAADGFGLAVVGGAAGDHVRIGRRSGQIRAALCVAQHVARADEMLRPHQERLVVSELVSRFGLLRTDEALAAVQAAAT